MASIPQYLGFLYINSESTPNTICLTEAGMALWHRHKDELIKVPNLIEGKESESLITKSEIVLKQMEKLQITNPIINKDCENIYVFPFRFMLRVLLKVGYLDQEEIAYFLFKVRNEDEVDMIVQEINNFRSLSETKREALVNAFKCTHIGNITLVKASSAGYFISLCQITGIMDKLKITPKNRNGAIAALKINDAYISYVEDLLNSKYQNIKTYDFADNLQLWIDYIGNPGRDYPPVDVSIINKTNRSFLIQIYKEDVCKYGDLIKDNGVLQFPMFVNEQYHVKVVDISSGDELKTLDIHPTFEQREYEIVGCLNDKEEEEETLENAAREILEHCEAAMFAGKTLNYLKALSKITGIDKTGDKSLRGAYFEYYVYKMLNILKKESVIDDVIWNGKIGKYGLPIQAPGGKMGTPDIVFIIDDVHIVVELTTIKSRSLQFSAEGSSVPDHIRLYKQNSGKDVSGIFCAPVIYERNTTAMKSATASYGIELHCITDKELIELLLTKDREKIKTFYS